MAYRLYDAKTTEVRYEPADTPGGTLTGHVVAGEPVRSSEELSAIDECAKAYLFDHPHSTVYIAEGERILDSRRNTTVDTLMGRYSKTVCTLWIHAILLGLYVIASAFHHYGLVGLALVIAVSLLYQVMWRLGIQNEVESGVVCAVILILLLILVPSSKRARENAHRSDRQASAMREPGSGGSRAQSGRVPG
jgi:hypothetical protein